MAKKNDGSPAGDQKENKRKWLVVLSIVNGVLAVLTLVLVCLVLPRVEVDFDYLGFLVGVLGVLFAVVLGYNIYSIIDLRGLIEQNRQNAEGIKKQRRDLNSSLVQLESELGAVYYQLRFVPKDVNLVRNSLVHLIAAVKITAQDGEFSDCCEMIEQIQEFYKDGGEILENDKDFLKECLQEVPDKDKIANYDKLKGVVDSLTVV